MSWDRVVRDSDDEEEDALSDVPTSVDPLQSSSEQRTWIRPPGNDNSETIDGDADNDMGANNRLPSAQYGSQIGVNFDDFLLQSPETAQARLSSSQQRREERWIPTEMGNGSIGAMMTEIGLAQRRLFDEDDENNPYAVQNLLNAPTTMDLVRSGYPMLNGQGFSRHMVAMNDSGFGGGESSVGDQFEHQPKVSMTFGVQEPDPDATVTESNEANATETICEAPHPNNNMVMDGNLYDTSDPHHIHSAPAANDGDDPNASYNYFESSLSKASNTSAEYTVPTKFNDGEHADTLHRTPLRSKSMQETTAYSPHDTEPISSLISPKTSRAKSDLNPSSNAQQETQGSTNDELSVSVAVEMPSVKKKRGRPKKQVAIDDGDDDDDELANSITNGVKDEQTPKKTEKRKRGRPPSNNQQDASSTVTREAGIRLPEPSEKTETLQATVDDIRRITAPITSDGHQEKGISFTDEHFTIAVKAYSPSIEEPNHAESLKKSKTKEPKKKKLKRGKTTSVILKKSYESDVEDDVIWVEEQKPATKPELFPGPLLETSTIENSIPEQDAAASKKRGRKRKKTMEEAPQVILNQDQRTTTTTTTTTPPQAESNDNETSASGILDDIPDTIPDNNATSGPEPAHEQQQVQASPTKQSPTTTPSLETPKKKPTYQQQQQHDSDATTSSGKDPKKGPDKHSPISGTSKVPYRVGLSRRARIAPLLKIVRK